MDWARRAVTRTEVGGGLGAAGRAITQAGGPGRRAVTRTEVGELGAAGRAITQAGGPVRRVVTQTEASGPGAAGRAITQAGGPARRKIKMPPQSESVEAAGLGGSKNLLLTRMISVS